MQDVLHPSCAVSLTSYLQTCQAANPPMKDKMPTATVCLKVQSINQANTVKISAPGIVAGFEWKHCGTACVALISDGFMPAK